MSKPRTKHSESDREVVKALLDSRAVNFEAIGAALAKYGPQAALMWPDDDDGYENFCLTMKLFVHLFRHPRHPQFLSMRPEDLSKLRETINPELHDQR